MPQIGTFTHDDGIGFVGHLTTLMLAQDILIVAAEPSDAENAPQYRVHIGLRGYYDPGTPLTDGTQVFRDGLQGQHQAGITANKLTDFIHQEQYPVFRIFTVQVLFDPVTEVFYGNTERLFGFFKPFMGSIW